MDEREIVEEVVNEQCLHAADNAQAAFAESQGIEQARCVLVVSTGCGTFGQHVAQGGLRGAGYPVAVGQEVNHIAAEETAVQLVDLRLLGT